MWDDFDLFVLFRRLLLIFGTTYTVVKTVSLMGRLRRFLRSRQRRDIWLRGYLFAQLAELRLGRFGWDAMHIVGLVAMLGGVIYLHRLVPLVNRQERRYQLGLGPWNSDRVRRELDERDIHRLEILFRRDRAVEIRVEYSDRRELLFARMETRLRERFGEPDRIQDSGPLRVGRIAAVKLFLWVRVWRWERDGRVLVVEGEHYGDDPAAEAADRHTYVFALSVP